jgi:hypothetical protein
VTANLSYCFSYRTTINNKLRITPPYFGHNFGTVYGNGTLYLESAVFPAGRYTSFLDCAGNGTLEYGGTGSYNLIADLYDEIPNLLFSGTGTRILPNKDLTICNQLQINGPTLDNNTYNRKLTIQGSMDLVVGAFNSGTLSGAIVSFAGSAAQSVANFTGTNSFYNLEINNGSGLTLNGSIDVAGSLLLTNGLIKTTSTNKLTIINTAINCVNPSGGQATSYIDGPLVKKINQGDNFLYPIGQGSYLGNKLTLSATQTGTLLWTAEYFNPNGTSNNMTSPLTAVNSKEYWTVSAPSGSQAIVNINWDPSSDITPLMTQNGKSDMRVAGYNTGTSSWVEIPSSAIGDDYNGTVYTSSRVTIPGYKQLCGGMH